MSTARTRTCTPDAPAWVGYSMGCTQGARDVGRGEGSSGVGRVRDNVFWAVCVKKGRWRGRGALRRACGPGAGVTVAQCAVLGTLGIRPLDKDKDTAI